jgi:hypothetical protein
VTNEPGETANSSEGVAFWTRARCRRDEGREDGGGGSEEADGTDVPPANQRLSHVISIRVINGGVLTGRLTTREGNKIPFGK